MVKQIWRLIPCFPASGKIQMAVDRWLLQHHQHQSLKTYSGILRFYTWSPPAISLGHHQKTYPDFWHHLIWQGERIDLVSRPSGGRAVLHQGDLTYTVITSGITGNRLQSYTKICDFLIQGWGSLGVQLSYGQAGRGYIHNPNCFGTATGADLILPNGAKLIGSAQLRTDKAILQHGSMVLEPDQDLFETIFGEGSFVPISLPKSLTREVIIPNLIAAACDVFNMVLEEEPLSPEEWQEIMASESTWNSPMDVF
ncbi:lipoate--protein ligase family protein [Cylindrospermopsis curvispora]|uniref:lipoate--protein ligase family protein n=1 Tax=Cylindrospermopsis curvispora TaxID=747548 RepID=UPI001F1BB2CE|nr:lipoate--protein ligase family protein [Cylindrospermopsis curvispora]